MNKFVGATLLTLAGLDAASAWNEISKCPKFIDQRFCESAPTKDGLAYFEWQRSMPRDEPWHQCNYPGDDYGCENIPDSVKPKKVDRGDNRCGRCDFDGYSSSFCYVDPVGNILATVVVEYKNQGCQKGAVEKRDGVHQPPRYHNFSTEAAPACYSTSQYGKPCVPGRTSGIPFDCKGGKCEDGQCCSPTEPQKTCVALGNGMCPDAGSHTQCEDPAEPGPWSCSWVQDELVNPVEKFWKLEEYDVDDDSAAAAPAHAAAHDAAHDAKSCYPKWHDCSYDDDCCDDNTCQPIKGTTVCFNGRRDDDWPLGAAELDESDDDHAHDDDCVPHKEHCNYDEECCGEYVCNPLFPGGGKIGTCVSWK